MAGFSGVLQLTDLDDFITPSQECIKPLQIEKTKSATGSKITIQDDGTYMQVDNLGFSQKLQKVEITLADCLACSGCITSAESVLITQQSQDELLKVFNENNIKKQNDSLDIKIIVVSISIQPILSLSVKYNLPPNECAARLSGYFKNLGADIVIDMTLAEDFALLENEREFIRRYRATESDNVKNVLPMLASSCPGWVCYAEKTHGNFILPYISTTKSPQQIMGSFIKKYFGINKAVYHVTVMPCYDKKLEASREDFFNKEGENRDVDCVITSIELEQMLQREGHTLNEMPESKFTYPWMPKEDSELYPQLTAHIGSGSGGYADHIFISAARELFGINVQNIEYRNLRNPDFRECTLEQDGKILLKFAIANGFKNIQNLVQKLKRGKSQYHYVEVMACPSGCLNGGAQARPSAHMNSKELIGELEKMYNSLPKKNPVDNQLVKRLYECWLGGVDSDKSNLILHTEYHYVEKMATALNIRW